MNSVTVPGPSVWRSVLAPQGTTENPVALSALAAAYAEVGKFDEAVKTATSASRLVESQDTALGRRIQQQLLSYQEGKPYYVP